MVGGHPFSRRDQGMRRWCGVAEYTRETDGSPFTLIIRNKKNKRTKKEERGVRKERRRTGEKRTEENKNRKEKEAGGPRAWLRGPGWAGDTDAQQAGRCPHRRRRSELPFFFFFLH